MRKNKTRKDRILKQSFSGDGYKVVTISDGHGNVRTARVHRLVASAFIPNDNGYPVINHKNENPIDNNVDNLEWCTVAYNTNYGTAQERKGRSRWKPVAQYTLEGVFVKEWESIKSASESMRISHGNIISCCKGVRKSTGGYKWQYAL